MSAPTLRIGLRSAGVLTFREMLHFLRQPARIAAAIGTPLLMWLFLASGFARSMAGGDDHAATAAMAYYIPGAITLVVIFTAIFSSISIIDDRRSGWLQSVLASPAPRWSIACGTIGGGALVAWLQAVVVMLLLPLIGSWPGVPGVLLALAALALTAIAVTALGLALAWRCETTQGYHAVMNLLFMPMWLLSGAFFPIEGAAPWLAWVMRLNPLTWCTNCIRSAMSGEFDLTPFTLAAIFACAMLALATAIIGRPARR